LAHTTDFVIRLIPLESEEQRIQSGVKAVAAEIGGRPSDRSAHIQLRGASIEAVKNTLRDVLDRIPEGEDLRRLRREGPSSSPGCRLNDGWAGVHASGSPRRGAQDGLPGVEP